MKIARILKRYSDFLAIPPKPRKYCGTKIRLTSINVQKHIDEKWTKKL